MNVPPIFAFTDCKDPNALTRLQARLTILFENSPVYGVGIDSDIEAAGCILDTLDAIRIASKPAIIIGNLAPRADKHYKNGAPFYIGHIDQTIIIATKTCFSLLAKYKLIRTINETDVETVCKKFLPEAEAGRIANSQFRSFEYVPRLAHWAYERESIPMTESDVDSEVEDQIWWVDNFGNSKTTITEPEIKERIKDGNITLQINNTKIEIPFYQKLADVPKGELGFIIGSSGYGDVRFAEIVKQGGNASTTLKVVSGTKIG